MQVQKVKPGYKLVKSRFGKYEEIPEEWTITSLENVSKNGTQNGLAISISDYGSGVPIVGMTKFYASEILSLDNMKEIVIDEKNQERFCLKPHDLLFGRRSMDGKPIGGAGKCIIVPEIKTPVVFESSIIRVSIKDDTNPSFIFHLLKSKFGKQIMIRIIRVSAVSGISAGDLAKIKFPLPPKKEQDELVKILSNVDSLIQQYDNIIESTKKLKTGLMQKLLTRGIGHTKFKEILWLFRKKMKIPESWECVTVGDYSNVTKLAGFEYTNYFKYNDHDGVPVIKAQNVQMGSFVKKDIQYITKEISDSLPRSQVGENDVLMTFIGEVGNVCLAPKGRWHLAPNVAKITPKKIEQKFLFHFFQSYQGRKSTKFWSKSTVQPSLSMETIRKIRIFLPPILEQQKIVSILSNVDSKIKDLKSKKSSLQIQKKGLMQKLLTGELRVKF